MSTASDAPSTAPSAYERAHDASEFVELRRRHRAFVFPAAIGFLAWYFLFVLMADYAPDFMSKKVIGNINIGLIFGLLQFASTFLITTLYVRYAERQLDPLAAKIRDEVEGDFR